MGVRNLHEQTPAGRGDSSPARPAQAWPDEGAELPDLQSLLSGAIARLAEITDASRAAAWAFRPTGEPFVAAASFGDATPDAPTPEDLAALEPIWQRAAATDLGDSDLLGTSGELLMRHGFSAAAPVVGSDGRPLAMLLLGGPRDPLGRVRPRSLAALDATVRRLRAPAAAALAYSRLSRLDEKVCRLERLASLGGLLSEVVHEVRNPLVSVKTFLQLLPDNLDDESFHGDFRQVVIEEVARLERLLDTVVEHARPESPSAPAPENAGSCEVADVLSSIARLLQQRAMEQQVNLVTDVAAGLPAAAMDRDSMRQVILNLTLNALEATPRDSSVTLRARKAGADGIELSIEDEGPGVAEPLRAQLFEPFFTTRSDRSGGLGLAISKRLVDAAGGSIEIGEAPGGGACFRVALPGG
jgi:signal transduction histidine kinase